MIDNGGTAFPYTLWDRDEKGNNVPRQVVEGLTVRDWFAGQALAGQFPYGDLGELKAEDLTRWCYELSDAMIAQRKKESDNA